MTDQRAGEVGCKNIMWRGNVTGRVITCGVCEWYRDHFSNPGGGVSSDTRERQPKEVDHDQP